MKKKTCTLLALAGVLGLSACSQIKPAPSLSPETERIARNYHDEAQVLEKSGRGQEAIELHKKAVELGYTDSMNSIGDIYLYGNGVPKDENEANKWFKMGAELSNMYCACSLGDSYYLGRAVPRSNAKAFKWYRFAADAGSDWGQNNLGNFYRDGVYVQQNWDKARELYVQSAARGNKWAKESLQKMDASSAPAGVAGKTFTVNCRYGIGERFGTSESYRSFRPETFRFTGNSCQVKLNYNNVAVRYTKTGARTAVVQTTEAGSYGGSPYEIDTIYKLRYDEPGSGFVRMERSLEMGTPDALEGYERIIGEGSFSLK